MGRRSRDKGKRGEREAAKLLSEILNVPVVRGQQRKGGPDSPDVIGVTGLHIEVKRSERLTLYAALEQARNDAGHDQVPVVMHRRNGHEWVMVVPCNKKDLIDFCLNILEAGGIL